MKFPADQDVRCEDCLAEMLQIMDKYGMYGMVYLADIEERDQEFSLCGLTGSRADMATRNQCLAVAQQMQKHAKVICDEIVKLADRAKPSRKSLPEPLLSELN